MTGVTSKAGTVYSFGTPPVSSEVRIAQSGGFCRQLFVIFFYLTIVLSDLRFADSVYPLISFLINQCDRRNTLTLRVMWV